MSKAIQDMTAELDERLNYDGRITWDIEDPIQRAAVNNIIRRITVSTRRLQGNIWMAYLP